MPNRILTYLDKMDLLREQANEKVDATFKKINIDVLLDDPKKILSLFTVNFIKKNNKLFKNARIEGKKLAESLK